MKKILNIDNCSLELSDHLSGVTFRDIKFSKTNGQNGQGKVQRKFE